MNNGEYLLNGVSVTWRDLISEADKYGGWDDASFKRTSEAATILRAHGYIVTRNPAFEESDMRRFINQAIGGAR